MRKIVRIVIYVMVIAGAYYMFRWLRPNDEHVEVHTEQHEGMDHDYEHEHDTDGSYRQTLTGEAINLGAFSHISINGAYEVHLIQGDEHSLRIEASDKARNYVKYEVSNDRLIVSTRKGKWKFDDGIDLYITVDELKSLNVSGGVDLESSGTIETESLNVNVSGAADLDMNMVVNSLEMELSGAANAELEGSAQFAKYSVSGAGHIEADELDSQDVNIGLSGAGAAEVHAEKRLDVRISGAGSVTYTGNPEIHKSISGLGVVHKR